MNSDRTNIGSNDFRNLISHENRDGGPGCLKFNISVILKFSDHALD